MASFIFVGDPKHRGDGPQSIDVLGHSFSRTKPTAVTNDAIIKKLEGNGHFERVDDVKAAPAEGAHQPKGKHKAEKAAPAEGSEQA